VDAAADASASLRDQASTLGELVTVFQLEPQPAGAVRGNDLLA